MMFEGKHNDLTEKVIGAFFKVNNQLGYGFSEKIYENAMVFEIRNLELKSANNRQFMCIMRIIYWGNSLLTL